MLFRKFISYPITFHLFPAPLPFFFPTMTAALPSLPETETATSTAITNGEPPAPLVELCGVYKNFGARKVLQGIDLTIHSGETLMLIGPSGGGKSTLLRCLNGLVQADQGTIRVAGHQLPLVGEGAHERTWQAVRRIFGMVFQDFRLFPHLTVLGNIVEAPIQVLKQPKALAQEKAFQLLKRVGLESYAKSYPNQLSGGQRQRVAIARALAMEPQGLLCDEITSALDPELKREVLEVIADLKQDSMTLVMVTHELRFAKRMADRVAVLAEGKIVEIGSTQEVFDQSPSEHVRSALDMM
jgi:polar amino acid transport system ATP-binding protein